MTPILSASLALAVAAPFGALAAAPSQTSPPSTSPSELTALRQEIDAMRTAYEARLQALEQRVKSAEAAAAATAAVALPAAAVAPVASVTVAALPDASPSVAPAAASSAGGANAFNPAMSLILSGLYTRTSKDPANYAITGFQLPPGAEAGPGARGLSLTESELGFAASIDPWLRGAANISLHPDNTISVEEAFIQTTALGNGLSLKAGRFFSGLGYLNPQHAHTWDFVDNPLAYQALLGTQYGDDGVQLNWLAPTDQYIEFGAELGRGRSFPGTDTSRNGAGMAALTAHTGGDIGASHSWRTGVSVLSTKATDQRLLATNAAGDVVTNTFSGNTRVWGRRCDLEVGPERQRRAHQLQAAGRVPAQHAARQPDLRRRQRGQRRQLSRRAVGLVRAGHLPVHAALARRPAHRATRLRIARLRPERGRVRERRLPAEEELADA